MRVTVIPIVDGAFETPPPKKKAGDETRRTGYQKKNQYYPDNITFKITKNSRVLGIEGNYL